MYVWYIGVTMEFNPSGSVYFGNGNGNGNGNGYGDNGKGHGYEY